MSEQNTAFENDAKPYGYDLTKASCHCCTYEADNTENRWLGWQAAIAYMQEQSEPVGRINQFPKFDGNLYKRADITWSKVSDGDLLYTTPQRQQPFKRLSEKQILDIYHLKLLFDKPIDYANAIMNAMQELNK